MAACLLGSARAEPGAWSRLQWVDLRDESPAASAYRRMWTDRLQPSQRAWSAGEAKSSVLPAYTLSQVFAGGVVVTALFDLYDCELPGNGPGADLYARCPARIVYPGKSGPALKQVERVCVLYVPSPIRSGAGPDPGSNFTAVRLAGRHLSWEVMQGGRPVPLCRLEVDLP